MRISAKGRYALAAMVHMAQAYTSRECITVISISETLGISKIYLEQVFSLLKRGDIVFSIKGAQGGYMLTRPPEKITVYDILFAIETSLFEETEQSVKKNAEEIDHAMHSLVFRPLDETVKQVLQAVSLDGLMQEAGKYNSTSNLMYYI